MSTKAAKDRIRPIRSAAKMAVERIRTQRRKYKPKNDNKTKESPSQQTTPKDNTLTPTEKSEELKEQGSRIKKKRNTNPEPEELREKDNEEDDMKGIFEDEISDEEDDIE